MSYYNQPTLQDFIRQNFSYYFGSLANVYSAWLQNKIHSFDQISKLEIENLIEEIREKALNICYQVYYNGGGEKLFDEFPELEKALLKVYEEEKKERKIGRYFASELYQIISNRITPEQYLNPPPPTIEDLRRMYWGRVIDEGLKKLFGQEEEKKYEIKIDKDITLVCKTDLEFADDIVEIKTKEDISSYEQLPLWYLLQAIAYLKAKELKKMRLYLIGWAFTRKRFDVDWNENTWKLIVDKLKEFHSKVLNLNKKI